MKPTVGFMLPWAGVTPAPNVFVSFRAQRRIPALLCAVWPAAAASAPRPLRYGRGGRPHRGR